MIRTARLKLIEASAGLLYAAIEGREPLARALGASVPETWPPQFLDDDALRYTIDRLAMGREQEGWWMYFIVKDGAVVGTAGYKGPPVSGVVEIGYGIVSDQQRQGLATEAARALIAHAFEDPRVTHVIAETLPELIGSIGVLRNCGFKGPARDGSEPGVIRFELARS
jgi:ribosomal-protein-alanine N-acetyltransferase